MKMHAIMGRISRGGQVTVPAEVRRRWGTVRIAVEDHGDHLLVRPLPDPVGAFVGFAANRAGPSSDEARARARAEEAAAEARRSR